MLTGASSKAYETNVKNIGSVLDGSSSSVQGFSKTQGDLKFQLDQAKASADALAIGFGDFLMPKVMDLEHAMVDSVQWFEKHKMVAEALAGAIGVTLAGAVGVFTVDMASGMIESVQNALVSLGLMEGETDADAAATTAQTAAIQEQAAATTTGASATQQLITAIEALTEAFTSATASGTEAATSAETLGTAFESVGAGAGRARPASSS